MVDSVQKLRPVDLFQRVDPVRGFDGVGPVGRIGGIVRLVRLPRVGDVVAVCRLVPDPVVGAVRSVGPIRTVVADAGNGAWVSGPVPRWQCPAPSGTDARRGRHRCRSSGPRLVRPRPTSSSAFDRLAGLVRTSSASSRASIAASLCSSCSCVTSWGWASRPSTSEFRCGASERRSLIRMPRCRAMWPWEPSTRPFAARTALASETGRRPCQARSLGNASGGVSLWVQGARNAPATLCVSYIRQATSTPEAAVSAATAQIASRMPKASARTPVRSAPTANPRSRHSR